MADAHWVPMNTEGTVFRLNCQGATLGCVGELDGVWYAHPGVGPHTEYLLLDEAKEYVELAYFALVPVPLSGGCVRLRPDFSRLCQKCQRRPRWSAEPQCRYCAECGRPRKAVVRRRLQYESPRAPSADPVNVERRERYRAARAQGAMVEQAKRYASDRSLTDWR